MTTVAEVVDQAYRDDTGRAVATLIRVTRDFDLAEEAWQEACEQALRTWPQRGVPRDPTAWLFTAARNRAIDRLRRERVGREKTAAALQIAELEAMGDDMHEIPDDRLRLLFTCCHPSLALDARVALTLRTVAGLTTREIARAFLVPEPTIAQRVVRAKRTLAEQRVPFEVPRGAELAARLSSVLAVIYLVFNEGYAATAGDDWMRPGLCEDALRLGRILAGLMPGEPEVHGLVALMEIQASRARARVGPAGEPILLTDQNRALWDRLLIRRGLAALERAEQLGGARGPYALQAAIAACHARAVTVDATDWGRIAGLYATLAEVSPSPIVELNRSVAVGMAHGPAAGLALADALLEEPALEGYHLLPCVRAEFLAKLGRLDEAREEIVRAAGLTRNASERRLLEARAAELARARG
jgi:RNA polymerase sigma factor (sigma-70 family)